MRFRSVPLLYLLTFFSGGLVSIVWVLLLMHDVNLLEGKRLFRVGPIAAVFAVGLTAHLLISFEVARSIGASPGLSSAQIAIGLALPLTLLALVVASAVAVARRVHLASGRRFGFTAGAAVVFQTLLLFLSLPILQARMNRFQRRKSHTKTEAE